MILLVPRSLKGSNVVKKWGTRWIVRQASGNRIMIVSLKDETALSASITPNSARWVQVQDDPDFDVDRQDPPPMDCPACFYRQEDMRDGGHCYMFREQPPGPNCGSFKPLEQQT